MLFISLIWHWSVNIGIWWYNWRPESMHILQVGLHSCSSCHWSHHGAKNAFMEWNGWTWTLARGKCCFVCFSFSTLAPCGLSRMFCRKILASDNILLLHSLPEYTSIEIQDLLPFMDGGPKDHHVSLSHKRPRESSLAQPQKTKGMEIILVFPA